MSWAAAAATKIGPTSYHIATGLDAWKLGHPCFFQLLSTQSPRSLALLPNMWWACAVGCTKSIQGAVSRSYFKNDLRGSAIRSARRIREPSVQQRNNPTRHVTSMQRPIVFPLCAVRCGHSTQSQSGRKVRLGAAAGPTGERRAGGPALQSLCAAGVGGAHRLCPMWIGTPPLRPAVVRRAGLFERVHHSEEVYPRASFLIGALFCFCFLTVAFNIWCWHCTSKQ